MGVRINASHDRAKLSHWRLASALWLSAIWPALRRERVVIVRTTHRHTRIFWLPLALGSNMRHSAGTHL